jgi:hypothetical protein
MENSLGVCNPQTVFLSRVSSVKTPIGEERMFGFLFTYPEWSIPTCNAAVRGQVVVLETSCFSILQKRHMSCSIPHSRAWIELEAKNRELEWSAPWRNEGFSGPGTSSSEILVYLRYAAYVTAAAPPKAAHCV